jgi:hypothetical protein
MTFILVKDDSDKTIGKVYLLPSGRYVALDLRTFNSSIHEDFESVKDWFKYES